MHMGHVFLLALLLSLPMIPGSPASGSPATYSLSVHLTGLVYNYTQIVVVDEDLRAAAVINVYGGGSEASVALPRGEYIVLAASFNSTSRYWWSARQASIGYAYVDLAGDSSVAVDMRSIDSLEKRAVEIHVYYVNGSPVKGAWVSAYTPYLWLPYREGLRLYGHTGGNGTARLTLYDIPYIVAAYKWIWLDIDEELNKTVEVGGENYTLRCRCGGGIRLYGKTILDPSAGAANITLHIVKEYRPVYPIYPVYYGPGIRVSQYAGEEAGGGPGYSPQPYQPIHAENPSGQGIQPPYPYTPQYPLLTAEPYTGISHGGEAGNNTGSVNETERTGGAGPGENTGTAGRPAIPVESAIILSAGIIIAAAIISTAILFIRRPAAG